MNTTNNQIQRLESDLRDCRNPAVLAKYPHLGDPALIAELEARLERLKAQLPKDAPT